VIESGRIRRGDPIVRWQPPGIKTPDEATNVCRA
jgi:MOSC domain-containing protein YiiM